MVRLFTTLIAGLLVLGAAAGADAKKLTLRWYGQSFFTLETTKGTKIAFDPHAIEAYGRVMVKADLVLVSHFHNDHTQIGMIEDVKKAKLLVALKGTEKKPEWNIIDEKHKDVRVRTVGTFHDDSEGMERGKNGVIIVETDGLKFCFLGDLGHVLTKDQVKSIGEVDVLMIPVGGVYTINGAEAKKVVEQLQPKKYILPMHYGTSAFNEVLPPTEFLDGQKEGNVKKLEKSNVLEIDPAFKPKEPTIVILGWK